MKQVALTDFLTRKELCQITELSVSIDPMSAEFIDLVEKKFIQPNMERINRSLGQENDSRYLSYAVAFVFSKMKGADHGKGNA